MDQVTFHYDTVLSDVHLLLPNHRHLMARLNHVGQPVFISKFKILWNEEDPDVCDLVSPPAGVEFECNTIRGGERVKLECDTRSGGDGCVGGGMEDKGKDGGAEKKSGGGVERAPDERGGEYEMEGGGGGGEGEMKGDIGGVEFPDPGPAGPVLDEDGDLEVPRRPREGGVVEGRERVHPTILSQMAAEEEEDEEEDQNLRDVIRIEHTMATPLEDVGKQVWRGAFLLADFILSQPLSFRDATVLELGAGTGLTSVVMATVAKVVYCTDIGEDLLGMCQRNLTLNTHLLEPTGGDIRVRELDWLKQDLCTDLDTDFSWSEEEVADLYDNTTFIIAADVCYDDDLTDGFFQTLYRVCSNLRQPCTAYLAIEKRLNFTLRHMAVSCDEYSHFRHCLSELEDMTDGRTKYQVEMMDLCFPQRLQYERSAQLELWKVTATPFVAL